MSDNDTLFHHGSHRRLLDSPAEVVEGRGIDAIVVPTARNPAYLADAVQLAEDLGCVLVTLHSGKWTNAAAAVKRVKAGVDLIAIDVPETARLNLPQWETSRVLATSIFARRTDLSPKRNLALMLGHMLDWSHMLFLDDDITQLKSRDVRTASGLLGAHSAVGLQIGGFPDNSVVCHAFRLAGGRQQSFVGGGALVINSQQVNSFFPDIYNEDWFFLLDGNRGLQPIAITGEVVQFPYDPFRSPVRARDQELGDVLAEGIYWLLDQGQSIDADQGYWAWFLAPISAQEVRGNVQVIS